MNGRTVTRAATLVLTVGALLAVAVPPAAGAAPSDDLVLPAAQHSTEKAKRLATAHQGALRQLSATIYHCLPWLEVHKQSIGFFKPKGAAQDERYLSLRVYIEQDASPQFARLTPAERAAAMFSRYVGALLRRMTADRALLADANLDGFNIILDWQKPGPRAGGERPINETIAVFIKTAAAAEYLAGRLPIARLSEAARVLGWDGETSIGQLRLKAWDDNFVATYKLVNYQVEKGVTCPDR